MGVPSFYRWLVNKYPKIVSEVHEQNYGDGVDNFYLDMNGIIHVCFHPDDDIFPPTSFREVFSRIHDFIDHLFDIVKPSKLLFMAIDGVAPRAKMNQQRSRRFRSSKDAQIAQELEDKLREQFQNAGKSVFPKQESEVSDSNIITPGTEFMHLLSEDLQSFIKLRMTENEAWGNIKIILSDEKVPGEGEHKIMSFIRGQRSLPGYNPNTRHCLYGLDADLIMLALATHEVHFSVLREEVLANNSQSEGLLAVGQTHKFESEKSVSPNEPNQMPKRKQHYQFLNVWVLREYLELDFCGVPPKKEIDLERVIDDFIFMCFFAGNDFLPHIPSLEIHEGCVDLLMHVYKEEFEKLGGYFVDIERIQDKKHGYIKLKRVEKFIHAVAAYEDKIFNKRLDMKDRLLKRIISEYNDVKLDEQIAVNEGASSDIVFSTVDSVFTSEVLFDADAADVYKNTKELKQNVKDTLKKQSDLLKNGDIKTDKVKFGKEGWKERYYTVKFNAQSPEEIKAVKKSVVVKYVEGLCWVLLYYFSDVPSWTWYYPYHYGPLASDFEGLGQAKFKFTKGLPFKPFDQLMGVLPPSSADALPGAYKELMTNPDSCIVDFYPTEFVTDLDGKRFTWQGLCKLPFIEEGRLLAATKNLENELKEHEKVRNASAVDKLFMKCSGEVRRQLALESGGKDCTMDCPIDGLKGAVHMVDGGEGCNGDVMCFGYELRVESRHIPRVLEGVNIPIQIVNKDDIAETILWHDYRGSNSNYVNRCPKRQNSAWKPSSCNPDYLANNISSAGRGFSFGRGKAFGDQSLHGLGSRSTHPSCHSKFQYDNRGSGSHNPSQSMARLSLSEANKQKQNVSNVNSSQGRYVPKFRLLMENSGNNDQHSKFEGNKQSNTSTGFWSDRGRGVSFGNSQSASHSSKASTGFWSSRGRGASFGNSQRTSQSSKTWKDTCLEVMNERSVQGTGEGGLSGKERGWYQCKD